MMVEVKWLEIYDLKYIIFCKSCYLFKAMEQAKHCHWHLKTKVPLLKKTSEKGSQRYLDSLNPSLNKTAFLDGKQQRHFGKVIKQLAENGLGTANVRVPKEFRRSLQFFTKLASSYQSPSFS